jgi:hypothetical protein
VEIRTSDLEHEASIRGIGLLYYLVFSFMFAAASLLAIISFMAKEAPPLSPLQLSWVLIFLSALGIFYWTLARGIRRLHRWIRIPSTILSLIGLVGVPLGTLINGYILYLLHSKKGVTVFSPEYKESSRRRLKSPINPPEDLFLLHSSWLVDFSRSLCSSF